MNTEIVQLSQIRVNDANPRTITDAKFHKLVNSILSFLLKRCGFNVLNISEHRFQPDGYTGLWLLSESHFAVHTFPEINKTYIELSSCNLEYYKKFLNEINKSWQEE